MRTGTVLSSAAAALLAAAVALTPPADARAAAAPADDLPPAGTPLWGWSAGLHWDSGAVAILDAAGRERRSGGDQSQSSGWLEDVSADARWVLYQLWPATGTRVWDVTRNEVWRLQLPEGVHALRALPQGLLTSGADGRLELRDYRGTLIRSYATLPGVSGAVPTPAGDRFMQARSDGAVVVRSTSTGAVENVVTPPSGTQCRPVGGWDTQRFHMTCGTAAEHQAGTGTAWAGGYAPTTPKAQLAPKGWARAWPTWPRLVRNAAGDLATWKDGRLTPFDPTPPELPQDGWAHPQMIGVAENSVITATSGMDRWDTPVAHWVYTSDNRVRRSAPWPYTGWYARSLTINKVNPFL